MSAEINKVRARVRLANRLPGGVDRKCNCGHTFACHPHHRGGVCMDHEVCGCDGFYPEGLSSDEPTKAPEVAAADHGASEGE